MGESSVRSRSRNIYVKPKIFVLLYRYLAYRCHMTNKVKKFMVVCSFFHRLSIIHSLYPSSNISIIQSFYSSSNLSIHHLIFLFIVQSFYPSSNLSLHHPIFLSINQSFYPSSNLSIHHPLYPSSNLSIHHPLFLSIIQSFYPSSNLSIPHSLFYPSSNLSIHLPFYLSLFIFLLSINHSLSVHRLFKKGHYTVRLIRKLPNSSIVVAFL